MFKKFKKNLSILLAGVLAIGLVACANTATESEMTDAPVEVSVDVSTEDLIGSESTEQDSDLKLETSSTSAVDSSTSSETSITSAVQTSGEPVSNSTNNSSNETSTTQATTKQTTTQGPSTTPRQTNTERSTTTTTTTRVTTKATTRATTRATTKATTRATTTQAPTTTTTENKMLNVSLTIDLSRLIDNPTALPAHMQTLVPASGYLARNVRYEVEPGTSALDVLRTYLNANGIPSEIQNYPTGAYIAGINNISQFDAGGNSGWQYSINGNYPNQAIDKYELKNGDVVNVVYIIDYLAEGS